MKSIKVSCNLLDDFICRLFINDISWEFLFNVQDWRVKDKDYFVDKEITFTLLSDILSLSRSLNKPTVSSRYGNYIEIRYSPGIGLEFGCSETMDSTRLLNRVYELFGKE